jgi:hypothetical protein
MRKHVIEQLIDNSLKSAKRLNDKEASNNSKEGNNSKKPVIT